MYALFLKLWLRPAPLTIDLMVQSLLLTLADKGTETQDNVYPKRRFQDPSPMAEFPTAGLPSISELPQDFHHLYYWLVLKKILGGRPGAIQSLT